MHESQCHEVSSFLTLTYEQCSPVESLRYRDFQLFMKRLRKAHGSPVRFFMCGEYGENFGRPHFHACLFGIAFTDRKYIGDAGSGMKLYRSATLERLWPHGFSSVGNVTFESAAYVARYALKKVTGQAAVEHYRCVDLDTGEVVDRVPEFCHMSLKPGIGALWYERFHKGVFPRDWVVINGKRCRVPRYYDKMLKRADGFMLDDVKYARELDAMKWAHDNTVERLRVKEQVLHATVSFLPRRVT
ncbi:VP4 [Kummerowia striata gokushovirus]|nr:VP4 [Kummerowia striata gokushovirus]